LDTVAEERRERIRKKITSFPLFGFSDGRAAERSIMENASAGPTKLCPSKIEENG